jgi:hypothetical protein
MTLPSFIGIGAERCGSTWLHLLLSQHPKIYVPKQRKELDFFNINFVKGLDWYESFFPDHERAASYGAIGEISPRYLNSPECAERIASMSSVEKLIAILRHPIDRAYSHYGHAIRLRGYSKSFEDFMVDYPDCVTHGFYADHLQSFLQYYERSQFCCLIFEKAVTNVDATKQTIADFLGVNSADFPEIAGCKKANETYIPKLKKLNYIATELRRYLIKYDWDWVINVAKKIGVQQMLKAGGTETIPPMLPETRLRLQDTFASDIQKLEQLLNTSLAIWDSSSCPD